MLYSKPELNQLGCAEELVLGETIHPGEDMDANGTTYPYRNIVEEEFSAL